MVKEHEYVLVADYESYGSYGTYGVKIEVALGRKLSWSESCEIRGTAAKIAEDLAAESLRIDPNVIAARATEKQWLLGLFGPNEAIFVEEIPNGYITDWTTRNRPWFRVTTRKGPITLGWRKRVIEITWADTVNGRAEALFPNEAVTKYNLLIHAYGYDKAREYIQKLLA